MIEIKTRRSIRQYQDLQINQEIQKEILKAGVLAPSARNQQPWSFISVENKLNLEKLSKVSNHSAFVKDASWVLVLLMEKENLPTPSMAPQDMAFCASNMMLEARHYGVGSCYLGIYPKEERMEFLRDLFSIPSSKIPFALVSFGYPKNDSDFKEVKRELDSKVVKEGF